MTRTGQLYVVATPIGNLGDISQRAREVLAGVAVIAAEDTRHSGRLLQTLGVRTPLLSLHEHNEAARISGLLERLRQGEDVALVSDAGTPLISDPGLKLVRAAIAVGVRITPVPGACAALTALMVAGLPTDRFCFEGFLPVRAAARRQRLEALANETRSMVIYEAPQRLVESLSDLAAVLGGGRAAVIARELTKLHESLYRGTLDELAASAAADANMCRGELVLVVAGAESTPRTVASELDSTLIVLLQHLSPSKAAAVAAELTGARRNDCYQRAMTLAGRQSGKA